MLSLNKMEFFSYLEKKYTQINYIIFLLFVILITFKDNILVSSYQSDKNYYYNIT